MVTPTRWARRRSTPDHQPTTAKPGTTSASPTTVHDTSAIVTTSNATTTKAALVVATPAPRYAAARHTSGSAIGPYQRVAARRAATGASRPGAVPSMRSSVADGVERTTGLAALRAGWLERRRRSREDSAMAIFEELSFDGFECKLARPEVPSPSPAPAVLVMPDAHGIGEFSIEQAGRLADLGYVALAGDPYGGGLYTADMAEIGPHFARVNGPDAVLRANTRAHLDVLAGLDGVDAERLGAIGYCMGGTAVLELARSGYAVAGVVSFHGLLTTTLPASRDSLVASILVCTGADDPYAPLDSVPPFQAEMTAAEADCQVIVYTGTLHGFTNPDPRREAPGIGYHAQSAARSWAAMLGFLHERGVAPAPN